MIVYLLTNTINGKQYVGKTVGKLNARWSRHKYDATHHRRHTHLGRAIQKYGSQSFIPSVLDAAENEKDLAALEQDFIFAYQTNSSVFGYNLTEGGEGSVGFKHTSETKEKLRNLRLGKPHPLSDNTRRAISDCNRKRIWSAEAKQAIAASNIRRTRSSK